MIRRYFSEELSRLKELDAESIPLLPPCWAGLFSEKRTP
jgi:hypothetical protein